MILIMAYIIMPVYRVDSPTIISKCGNKTIVSVDGRLYDVTVNEDNVVVESNTKENKQKMIMDKKGNAKIFTEDSEGNKQTADMKIDELSEDNIKAEVTFQDGTTKRYNSIDDLGQDRYVGKNVASAFAIAVPVGVVITKAAVAALAKAAIATGVVVAGVATAVATIKVAGEIYERLDALAEELVKKKPPKFNRYFKAHIDKNTNTVFISQKAISFEQAKIMMNAGTDIYTPIDDDAFNLALSAGWAPIGPENHGKEDDKNKKPKKYRKQIKPGIYYSHYHPCHRRCHIFYDKPTIVYPKK